MIGLATLHLPAGAQYPEAWLPVVSVPDGHEVGHVVAVRPLRGDACMVLMEIEDAALIGGPENWTVAFAAAAAPR